METKNGTTTAAISANNLIKRFGTFNALDGMSVNVKRGSIYGLIGVNGSGKTTALKTITGIIKPDEGSVTMDGSNVFENLHLKQRLGFISDELYFFGSYTLKECSQFYARLFPRWNRVRYTELSDLFALPAKRKLMRFSKGMQKQAAFILTMSAQPDFLVLDEPIDGLDPLVRKQVRKQIIDDVASREMTVLVSSHNLREMEGLCDSIGIVNKGKTLLERDLDELKTDIHKVQVAYSTHDNGAELANADRYPGLHILHREIRGAIELLIIRAPQERVEAVILAQKPVLFDLLPLSLEEIFIYELGGNDLGILF
jgi:ABC-2 type transport system ATP-binding protein